LIRYSVNEIRAAVAVFVGDKTGHQDVTWTEHLYLRITSMQHFVAQSVSFQGVQNGPQVHPTMMTKSLVPSQAMDLKANSPKHAFLPAQRQIACIFGDQDMRAHSLFWQTFVNDLGGKRYLSNCWASSAGPFTPDMRFNSKGAESIV
jgi:hypothetical protein